MNRVFGNYKVTLRDEPAYSIDSTDNPRSYSYEYFRDDDYHYASAHGINVFENDELLTSAIVLGFGGATGVYENSVAYDGNSIYVAAGDALHSLSLPTLELNWVIKVDSATCFGVFWLKERNVLLTWGELEIGCYSNIGEKIWSADGPDIFTEGFELEKDIVKVTDFNGQVFTINLSDGVITNANT